MNTNQKILAAAITIIILGIALLIISNQSPATPEPPEVTTTTIPDKTNNTDKTKPLIYTEQGVIQILKTNTDAVNYMNKNRDFEMNMTPLSSADIIAGQNATNFREVYQNLTLEDNRYLKVDLMNNVGRGLITVVDMETRTVVKLYGMRFVKFG